MSDTLKAPFVWYGGKSKVADLVWKRFGKVDNYIEPFAGSAAVLLARPIVRGVETINDPTCGHTNFYRSTQPGLGDPGAVADAFDEAVSDADPHVANVWRSIQGDPEGVAEWAGYPVQEDYLHAVHRWLVLGDEAAEFRRRMRQEPDYFDAKRAGRWLFGINCWIGGGWCAYSDGTGRKPPTHKRAGNGVHARHQQRPVIANPGNRRGYGVHNERADMKRPQITDAYDVGRGVHSRGELGTCAQRTAWLVDWFSRLRDRLRNVRVCCGDWARVCTSESVTTRLGVCGVFLDPPYSKEAGRDMGLYACESGTVAHDVRRWCLERGGNPKFKIALCGYAGEGHEELERHGWRVTEWKSSGYGNRTERGKKNAKRERLFWSPHCQFEPGLFDHLEGGAPSGAPGEET